MDNGPFGRTPRPTERRANAPAPRPEAVQQPVATQQRTISSVAAPASPRRDAKSVGKKWLISGVIAVVVIALLVGGWLFLQSKKGGLTGIDSSKYQAVFFTNGQTYFGKLTQVDDNYLRLTDIFYLQSQNQPEGDANNPQSEEKAQSNVTLIKLGDEIHGPEDEMMIEKSNVLFYENIKADGKVGQSIATYKKSR